MANKILSLSFHLRKPHTEINLLIEAFNKIIEEGGRCGICIQSNNILQINMCRSNKSCTSVSLNAKIADNLSKRDLLNISKLNFGSAYFCKILFELQDPKNERLGQTINLYLLEHADKEIQKTLNQHFKILDLALKL